MKHTILHISSDHSSFDDRIFYKELISLSEHYNCYLIAGGNSAGMLTKMGNKLCTSPGIYNSVNIIPYPLLVKNIFARAFRKFFPNIYNLFFNEFIYRKIVQLCIKNNIRPVILHYHDLSFFKVAKRMQIYFHCKLIFDCHEFYFSYYIEKKFNYRNLQKSAKSLLYLKNAVHNADATISVTKNLDNIVSLMSSNQKHIVVYNSSIFPVMEKQKNVNSNKVTLIHEGSLKFNRGLSLMLELFEDDFFRKQSFLRIVGNLPDKELNYFQKKKNDYAIDDTMIEITGWIDYENVYEYLSGDIGIIFFEKTFNAYYSMPNKLFNYINAGLLILSVQCAESSELITANKIGVIVERDIDSIKEGLHELITNYDYYQQNVRNTQELFSWKNEEIKLLSLYKNLLNHDA
jgi:glycosyltransferase involved in cell wall biosynthesis